jgi:hypothetical protein
MESAHPDPYNFAGVEAPFLPSGFRDAGRLSGHLARAVNAEWNLPESAEVKFPR